MRNLKAVVTALCLVGALAVSAAAQNTNSSTPAAAPMQKSLYERLGGLDAIKAVIGDFAGRVLADTRINKKFAKSDPTRLTHFLVEQVCAATGGPCKYTGNSMKKSHKNMKVTEGEFNALVEDLVATLDKFNVPAKEKGELLSTLAALKTQIVEVNSSETGTRGPWPGRRQTIRWS